LNSSTNISAEDVFKPRSNLCIIRKTGGHYTEPNGTALELNVKNILIGKYGNLFYLSMSLLPFAKVPDRGGRAEEARFSMPAFKEREEDNKKPIKFQQSISTSNRREGRRVQGGWQQEISLNENSNPNNRGRGKWRGKRGKNGRQENF